MQKLTRKSLHDLNQRLSSEIKMRVTGNKKAYITVGVDSAGIENGAQQIVQLLHTEIEAAGMHGEIIVLQSGESFLSVSEQNNKPPLVEVILRNQDPVVYQCVTPDIAKKIIHTHIIKQQILTEYISDSHTAPTQKEDE